MRMRAIQQSDYRGDRLAIDPRNPDAAAGAKTTRYNFVLSERLAPLCLGDGS